MTQIDELDRLLGEWLMLGHAASKLQVQPDITPQMIISVQETYLKWLHEAYALLHPYYQAEFWRPYEGVSEPTIGGSKVVGIQSFITDPLRKRRKPSMAAYASGRPSPPEYEWAYPYDRYFAEQSLAQRRVLVEAREWYKAQARMQHHSQPEIPKLEALSLHPEIVKVAASRYASAHYDDAVASSIVAVNEAVRRKSGSTAQDGDALMKHAFSAKKPLLRLSGREDEQQAFMNLFAASWSALRNPRAHRTSPSINDAHAAIELLGFASALMRFVDESEKINRE